MFYKMLSQIPSPILYKIPTAMLMLYMRKLRLKTDFPQII